MQANNLLFTEKYRPASLDDLIVPNRVLDKLSKGVYQHLLFHGSPGTGKTSAAKALVKQFSHSFLYINASTDTSVDVVRNRITDFCANRSLMDQPGKMKVIILDEIDGVSDQFFKALRATMDQFSTNTRFIATCNYINKVPDPIQSRFEMIDFDFSKEEEKELMKGYITRLFQISQAEGLDIDKHAILELVKRKFPDLRNMLNVLQGFHSQGNSKITIDDIRKFSSVYKDIYEIIFKNSDPVKNYEFLVSEYSNRVDDVLASLGNELIEYMKVEQPEYLSCLPEITVNVAKYQAQRNHVIDPTVTMLACIYELQMIINKA
jgi:DNA polymerase III delta prime subunit